jgi:hypothetical protein
MPDFMCLILDEEASFLWPSFDVGFLKAHIMISRYANDFRSEFVMVDVLSILKYVNELAQPKSQSIA